MSIPPLHHLLSFLTIPNRALLFPGHLKLSDENQWNFWEPMEFFDPSATTTDFKKSSFYNLLIFFACLLAKEAVPLKMNHLSPFKPLIGKGAHSELLSCDL